MSDSPRVSFNAWDLQDHLGSGALTWTSPVRELGFGATELVPSWSAQVPRGTWLEIGLRAVMQDGQRTSWLTMARYAFLDTDIRRASVSPDAAPFGKVDTDTFVATAGWMVTAYQLRISLHRALGADGTPRVWRAGAVASRIPDRSTVPATAPGDGRGIVLDVPGYSQMVHRGKYLQYGGGGAAWCSPASCQMVAEYWGMRPGDADLAWLNPQYPDPSVAYAARYTYDYRYQGTGNWAFSAAYASGLGLDAQVVRLSSVADLEVLVAHGIPVITSQAFEAGEIAGADYTTDGHLWVVTGFTRDGDVVVNDPANPSNAQVRQVFRRRQFENAWLRTRWTRKDGSAGHSSGGVAYLIRPHGMDLPPHRDPANPAW